MSSVAAPIEAPVNAPNEAPIDDGQQIAASRSLEESRAHFRQALTTILANSLINRWWGAVDKVLMRLTRRQKVLPFPLTVVCLNLFALIISYSISLALQEPAIRQPTYILSRVVWVSFTILYILVMNGQLIHAVEVLSTTITENIPSPNDLTDLQNLIRTGMRIVWQLPFSLLFALICGAWIPYMLAAYSEAEFPVGAIALHLFNYFQVGMYIYFLLVVIAVLLGLSKFELDIYANDPRISPVVRSIYAVCTALTLCAASLGAIQYFLMSVSRIDMSAPFALLTLIVLGFLPPIGLFITIHLSLARIMNQAKGRKLAQIVEIIEETERNGDLANQETLESIQRLMDFHERIRATPNSMINLSSLSNLFASLLLPLIATVLGNFSTILALFGPSSPP